MTEDRLSTIVLSDLEYEQLVAAVSIGSQFLYLPDREHGRENIRISFPLPDGELGTKVPLADFIAHLQAAADNLRR